MAEIERLSVVWDARFDKLEEKLNKTVRATYGAASKIERRLDATNDNVARKFGRGIGTTIRGQLEGVASRAGPAAGALDAFGLAGLGAAAALGTLAVAASRAVEAMAFGDELQTAADKLQITAEAMQELQFSAEEVDVPIEALREGLFKLNGQLGALKTGIGGKRVETAFAALGITKESLKDVTNANQLLPLLADRLGQVKDTASQVQIARKLGIEQLLPLLRQGSDGLAEMRDRARELGLVISNDTVKALAEADRQMELATRQIQANLRVAFSGLAVDIAKATAALAEFLTWLRQSQAGMAVFLRSLGRIPGAVAEGTVNLIPGARQARAAGQEADRTKRARQLITDIKDALSKPLEGSAASQAAGFNLTDVSAAGKGGKAAKAKQDTSVQRSAEVASALRDVERELLGAWQNLLVGGEARADLQRLLLDLEKEGADATLNQQIADIKADEGLNQAKKDLLVADLEIVRGQQAKVDELKRELIERELAQAKAQEALTLRQSEIESQTELLQLQGELARTAAQRRDIELQLLDLADQRVTAEQEAIIASKQSTEAEREIARRRLAQLGETRGAREAGVRQGTQGPMESFLDSLPKTAAEANERLEALAANGLSSVVEGLAAAGAGARSLKDVLRSVISQMLADITRLNLQRALSGLISSFAGASGVSSSVNGIFGYAGGTNSARGGLSMVGERGPELVNLPRGAQVIPNDILRSLARRGGPASNSFSPTLHVNVQAAPGMTMADARRTGDSIAAAAMERMAMARRKGF